MLTRSILLPLLLLYDMGILFLLLFTIMLVVYIGLYWSLFVIAYYTIMESDSLNDMKLIDRLMWSYIFTWDR